MQTFEEVFSDFLERREYDAAQSALFSIVRTSFTAGWNAAGGSPPPPHNVVELFRTRREIPQRDHPDSIEADIIPKEDFE